MIKKLIGYIKLKLFLMGIKSGMGDNEVLKKLSSIRVDKYGVYSAINITMSTIPEEDGKVESCICCRIYDRNNIMYAIAYQFHGGVLYKKEIITGN